MADDAASGRKFSGISRREGLARIGRAAPLPSKVSAARKAAFEILQLVAEGRGHSDDLLHGRLLRPLSNADKNLATTLVMGVLRWQIALDASIRPWLARPDAKLAQPVAVALRMGAFQLLHLDRIPPHAALSESVELAREAGQIHAAGMVNAVLRKIAAAPKSGPKLVETTAAFTERLGHPLWLVERWVTAFGRSAAVKICEADQREPGVGTFFAAADDAPVMDDGSRLVAELAAASAPTAARVWDCCAAPGGKTQVLARRLPQAELLATDVSARRLKALAERLAEAGSAARTVEADAVALPAEFGSFDLILCDVPCSGTGTLARNPEIRHTLEESELLRQSKRQREILAAAARRMTIGGRLVYSTCSLEAEENERVVDGVLGKRLRDGELRQVDAGPLLERLREERVLAETADVSAVSRNGVLRTLPGNGFDGDGFFAAVFERLS